MTNRDDQNEKLRYQELLAISEKLYLAVKTELAAHPNDSLEGVQYIEALLNERQELILTLMRGERGEEKGHDDERQVYLRQLVQLHQQTEPLITELYAKIKDEAQQFQLNKQRHQRLQRMAEGYQTEGYLFDERK